MITHARNEAVPMTRRYPNLRSKQTRRDSKILAKIVHAWDEEKNARKVLDIFVANHKKLSDQRYWETLRSVWIISGINTVDEFLPFFKSNRKHRHYFSSPEEHKLLADLPNAFTVYRATNFVRHDKGISWSLSKEYVLAFQKEVDAKFIKEREVKKSDVFAIINRNQEDEIIILKQWNK